ncbi:MAG: integration host factor subunit alpha [Bdellovibrionaceae bacterium]|nr:integration host factor subunit alpha [Pseudobdellovibrionaceae bacterium]MDW8190703.1 integration host factor subunit alpha [Pseudobdellovibrionaceae bacterium]
MTLTKADLIEEVYQKIGFSKKEASHFVELVFDLIMQEILTGKSVKISGFGTFVVRKKKPRRGRNPQTGEPIVLPGRYVVTFRPSQQLRDIVNGQEVPEFLINP